MPKGYFPVCHAILCTFAYVRNHWKSVACKAKIVKVSYWGSYWCIVLYVCAWAPSPDGWVVSYQHSPPGSGHCPSPGWARCAENHPTPRQSLNVHSEMDPLKDKECWVTDCATHSGTLAGMPLVTTVSIIYKLRSACFCQKHGLWLPTNIMSNSDKNEKKLCACAPSNKKNTADHCGKVQFIHCVLKIVT